MVLLLAIACSGTGLTTDTAPDTAGGVPDGPQACGYSAAKDLDPSPTVVEVDLTASALKWDPGTGVPLTDGMAYDGTVPGPLIEANVGDTIVAHFHNDLSQPLTIHWHGLRIDSDMDGGMQMMMPVEPGESFDYTFVPPDPGFYWYHPHLDGATTLERGLYGAIRIHGPGEVKPDCELPIVLDDLLLDDDAQVAPPDTSMMKLMGRLGNVLMANGRSDREVLVQNGQTILMPLVVSSNARFWDVYVEGQSLSVVATDGGWLAAPYTVEHLPITPGERYIVAFTATGSPGEAVRLMNKRFQLHEEGGDMIEVDPLGNGDNPVMSFVFGDDTVEGVPWVQPPDTQPAWTSPPGAVGHHWVLEEDMAGGSVTLDGAVWPDVPVVTVPGHVDTTFEIENKSEMHHPFHIHGNRFQVLTVNGVAPTTPPAWKDTWDVPPRSTVVVASDLAYPGDWMVHCHILEHADGGMMGEMVVE